MRVCSNLTVTSAVFGDIHGGSAIFLRETKDLGEVELGRTEGEETGWSVLY